ncbi:arylsulfatase A [Neorhodopirellula lusitana]|uniref:Arylsulfatase A n=2 Tax=Neorhodopirellula lusitana TaxID=445327 RepID=A0ABY1PQ33_9BACT|nr:arylsulfatase A [Neorhodopirellula lusitana]
MNLKQLMIAAVLLLIAGPLQAAPMNVIIILTDDQGYEDLGCFGSTRIKTPNIDQMAAEGIKLTSFYTAASVCSPSRAALLTGRMPKRAGVPAVLFPYSQTGLPEDEITIAELLKTKDYATGIVGKWHLGHLPKYLPINQGFDSYFGLPYSNDMSIAKELAIASEPKLHRGWTMDQLNADVVQYQHDYKSMKNVMPLMRGQEVIEYPVDQSQLTKRYTEEAVQFIHQNRDHPFFLYLPHSMPHNPIHVSEAFDGVSGSGRYCDSIEEIDWSVGEIRKAVSKAGLDQHTFIVYCSDNGPANRRKSLRGSSAGPLRGFKFDTFEGGQRVPAVLWAPSVIPPGSVSNEILSTLDLLPTIAHYVDVAMPRDRVFDGYDISDVLEGKSKKSPRHEMYFYKANSEMIDGIRAGDWKYLKEGDRRPLKPTADQSANQPTRTKEPMLFHLNQDLGERTNLHRKYPEKVEELKRKMKAFDATIQ